MPRQNQIVAVVIKHYGTGLYRTCVSLARDNMVSLGTYRDERSASDKIGEFWKAYDEGQIKHPDDLSRLISETAQPGNFGPMSDSLPDGLANATNGNMVTPLEA